MAWWRWIPRREKEAADAWRDLAREEARLWMWIAAATVLALLAFSLSAIPAPPDDPFAAWRLSYEQTAPALLLLLLLFNSQMLRRRWRVHRHRKELEAAQRLRAEQRAREEAAALDEVTGLGNRKTAEQHLGKEMAYARRRSEPLSLLVIGLEDFSEMSRRIGKEKSDQLLRGFADQLRRATRGADYLARFDEESFLAILPRCPLRSAARVAQRLGPVTLRQSGAVLTVEVSTSWLDPQPGETPAGVLKRVQDLLRLYRMAGASETEAAQVS